MAIHVVLDHSALIPCGSKPEEEKIAIHRLGDILPSTDIVWYVSAEYLKTVATVCIREWRNHHPLPKLQSSLHRIANSLARIVRRSRSIVCNNLRLAEDYHIKMHVVARTALNSVDSKTKNAIDELRERYELWDEDVELLAIAVLSHGYVSKYGVELHVVTADSRLENALNELRDRMKLRIVTERPSTFLIHVESS